METGTWLRLGLIAAVSAIAVWVLMPTVVSIVDGPEVLLSQQAADVDKGSTARHRADLKVLLQAEDTEHAQAAVEPLEARLNALGIGIDGVEALDERVRVTLAPGARREEVEAAIATVDTVALYPVDAAGFASTGVAAWTEAWWPDAVGKDGAAVAAGATPAGQLVSAAVGPTVTLKVSDGAPTDLVVTVNDAIRGFAHGDGAGTWEFHPTMAGERDAWPKPVLAALVSSSLPKLSVVQADAVAAGDPSAEGAKKEYVSRFPSWFLSLLPNTLMSQGLDLRGGIDMTLEVDAEETVARELVRDAKYVSEQAPKDGIKLTAAAPDRARPMLLVDSTSTDSEVAAWVQQRLSGKGYTVIGREPLAAGGTRYEVAMSEEAQRKILGQYTDQVLETLRKRIDATGVKEPTIVQKGTGRVGIQLPGLSDLQQAVDAVGTTAVLEFRLVDEDFPESQTVDLVSAARKALPPDQFEDDLVLDDWLHRTKRLPEDRVLRWHYDDKADGDHRRLDNGALVLKREVMLTGTDIENAYTNWDQNGQPHVGIEFKSHGAQVFCTVTGENVRKRFAILLDDEIRSAPNIKERICGGHASIEMGGQVDGTQAANTLAVVLRTGSLDAPVTIVALQTVGSTLGKDAIWNGALAAMVGSSLVFLYMMLWYRVSGLVADITLAINVLVMLAALAAFGATLTLPGICGFALTVGMAVDSNIVIYERIREELRTGVNARKAVEAGFEHAASSIIDANVTTLIAGIVLYSYGTGPIKGFAVSLNIGIFTTLFTALFVSRALMDVLTRSSTSRLSI